MALSNIIQITSLSIYTFDFCYCTLVLVLALALALAHSNSTIDNKIICYMEEEPKLVEIGFHCIYVYIEVSLFQGVGI